MLERYRSREARGRRIVRVALQVLAMALVVLLGYQIASQSGGQSVPSLHDVLYWPLALVGVLVGLAAMTLTGNAITLEKARGTWDSLRITVYGARLVFQARWAAAFYMLRGPLGVLLLARVIFVLGILIDLMQYYQGRFLDLLLSGSVPPVSVVVGVALLAATMTVGLLQPLVAVGLDAAVGLVVSVMVREPRYDVMVRTILGVLRVGFAVLAMLVGSQAFDMAPWMTPAGAWGGVLFQSLFGDQALRLLDLEKSALLWSRLEYGVFIGLVLLVCTVAQAWLAGQLVSLAARFAEHAE